MLTIAEEMSVEERASQLLVGLSASSAEEVGLYFEHLAHAIGMELAEKMVVMAVGESSTKKSDYSTKPQAVNHCLCIVNRKQALDAVKKVLSPKPFVNEPSNDF